MSYEEILSKKNLGAVHNYREFLGLALKGQPGENRKTNLSEFSRRAGFSSRSFIVDVLNGKKRLTARSLPKVT